MLGFTALAFGIFAFTQHNSFAVYFTLFGLAAIFTFAGFSVLPTARNNRTAIMKNDAQAQEKMQAYLSDYLNFPLFGPLRASGRAAPYAARHSDRPRGHGRAGARCRQGQTLQGAEALTCRCRRRNMTRW